MRKHTLIAMVAVVLAVSAGAARAGAAQNQNPGVLPVNGSTYGMTYGQWSAAWWQWAFSLPNSTNPIFQEGNVDCSFAQAGHVWFLTGVLNVSGSANRTCSIPAGTALYFPIINVECSTLEPPPFNGTNEAELRACAHSFGFTNLSAEIDGRPLQDLASYTVDSPLFSFTVPDDNVLGVPGGSQGQSVGNGVYLMLAPLAPGEHTLHFGGTYPDFGGFTLDITYHLTVLPPGNA